MTEKNTFGDFAGAISALADERGIDKEQIFSTVEVALAAAYKKEYGKRGQNVRAELDALSGGMKFWLVKEVVDETTRIFIDPEEFTEKSDNESVDTKDDKDTNKKQEEEKEVSLETVEEGTQAEDTLKEEEVKLPRFNVERDITLEDALVRDKEAKVGDTLEEELPEHTDFGRVAAQTAKQVIIQRVRESERESMYQEYKEKEGELLNGTVQRIEGRTVFVDLGKSVGVLFPREQVRGEHYTVGQRIKVYLESVELDTRGPGVKLSRVHAEMVRRLFEMEVPEIFTGTVEFKSIAREAGSRSKIAVFTDDDDIDPVGSCVGQKGTRVNAVIDELGGEKIDIIEWNEDMEEFIAAALSPAQVLSVNLDEETHRARVVVPDDQLSLAIGKRGQNVRLAVKLTGWDLDVENASGEGSGKKDDKEKDGKEDSDDIASKVEDVDVGADADAEVDDVQEDTAKDASDVDDDGKEDASVEEGGDEKDKK